MNVPFPELLIFSSIGFGILLALPAIIGELKVKKPDLRWIFYTFETFTTAFVIIAYLCLLGAFIDMVYFLTQVLWIGELSFEILIVTIAFVVVALPIRMLLGWLLMKVKEDKIEKEFVGYRLSSNNTRYK